ncbi:MAG: hypothetical protein J7578_00330 [Chitinophagaceae bacterium]|nr:hypothetical protein [Chitinophagaceae bacterium]
MSLDIPVFDLKPLKKYFNYFLIAVVSIAAICIVSVTVFHSQYFLSVYYLQGNNNWYFLGAALLLTYVSGTLQKKSMKAVQQAEDTELKFSLYTKYYSRKLFWGAFSFFITGLLWMMTGGKFLFYFFVFQFVLSLVFHPNKAIITRELNIGEIEFI